MDDLKAVCIERSDTEDAKEGACDAYNFENGKCEMKGIPCDYCTSDKVLLSLFD